MGMLKDPVTIMTFSPLYLTAYFCFLLTALGVTAGAHRLWSHRSYKAKLPLRIFLAAANSMAFQVGREGLCCGDSVQKAVWGEGKDGLTFSTLVLAQCSGPKHSQSVPIFFFHLPVLKNPLGVLHPWHTTKEEGRLLYPEYMLETYPEALTRGQVLC